MLRRCRIDCCQPCTRTVAAAGAGACSRTLGSGLRTGSPQPATPQVPRDSPVWLCCSRALRIDSWYLLPYPHLQMSWYSQSLLSQSQPLLHLSFHSHCSLGFRLVTTGCYRCSDFVGHYCCYCHHCRHQTVEDGVGRRRCRQNRSQTSPCSRIDHLRIKCLLFSVDASQFDPAKRSEEEIPYLNSANKWLRLICNSPIRWDSFSLFASLISTVLA